MEGQEFLTEYRNISNKLKKRFLRRPNVSEASDQFRQLARRLEDAEEPQYAAFCQLAIARCEQTIANTTAEVEATVQAARSFFKAELEVQQLHNPSFEEHLIAAISSYTQAAKLYEDSGKEVLAACLYLEVGNALWVKLRRPGEAVHYYRRAAELQASSVFDYIHAQGLVADCYIALADHHNALLVLSDVASLAEDHDPCGLYAGVLANCEVLRVLMLLIIRPSPHNTPPHLMHVLDKYKWEGDEESEPCEALPLDTGILLQSVVMAVQVGDTESLLSLEDELAEHMTDQQRRLLRTLVTQAVKGG